MARKIAVKSFTADFLDELDKKVNNWLLKMNRADIIKIDYFPNSIDVTKNKLKHSIVLDSVFGFCAIIQYYTNK